MGKGISIMTRKDLLEKFEQRRALTKLFNTQRILHHMALDFENPDDKELDSISLKATHIESCMESLMKEFRDFIIKSSVKEGVTVKDTINRPLTGQEIIDFIKRNNLEDKEVCAVVKTRYEIEEKCYHGTIVTVTD
jgi:hypothetical protein